MHSELGVVLLVNVSRGCRLRFAGEGVRFIFPVEKFRVTFISSRNGNGYIQ